MLKNYEEYLFCLDKKLFDFFRRQKEYIRCKKGCSLCCRNINPPFTEIEFLYLKEGINLLDEDLKKKIFTYIAFLKKKESFDSRTSTYTCPFLIDDTCCVYKYRGIICRSFGLLFFDKNDKIKVPFCSNLGLNYSSVYDKENSIFSEEKYEQLGYKNKPTAYNTGYNNLTSKETEEEFNFKFGERKPLIEWFDFF